MMENENQAAKRFYWLRLKDDFFSDIGVIALRKLPAGDTNCVIYLKLLLLSLKTDGVIEFSGFFPTIEEELANLIGETVKRVKICVGALINFGLAVKLGDGSIKILAYENLVGSESQSAKKMRELRERRKVQESSTKIAPDDQPESEVCNTNESQCDHDVTNSDRTVTKSDTEKEIEIEIEPEKREKSERKPAAASRFARPTLDDVKTYCLERKNRVDPEKWLDYYTANGFMVGRSPMKDWKAAVRQWERNGYDTPRAPNPGIKIDHVSPGNYGGGW